MEALILVIGVAVPTFLTRYVGLAMPAARMPAGAARALRYVPMAVFAALVTTGINMQSADAPAQAIGLAAAAVAAMGRRPFWLSILVGMLAYGAARWVL